MFITPNEWNTFQQLHIAPEAIALSNKIKELIQKNKFKHKLGPGGYKVAIPLWTRKEHELHEARILDPLEGCMLHTKGCMLHTKNWIQGWSRTNGSR
jgi:hypothetical protein